MPKMKNRKMDHLMTNGIPIAKAIQPTIQNKIYGLFGVPIFLVYYPTKMIFFHTAITYQCINQKVDY